MVSVQREVELKFAASDDFVLPGLSQSRRWAVAGPAGEVRLEAVYYDTDTLTLAREGIGLRTMNAHPSRHERKPAGGHPKPSSARTW